MASTLTFPCSSTEPYKNPPLFIEKARAWWTYCWNMLAACRSNDTEAQCGTSCLGNTAQHIAAHLGILLECDGKPKSGKLAWIQIRLHNCYMEVSGPGILAQSNFENCCESSRPFNARLLSQKIVNAHVLSKCSGAKHARLH